MHGIGLCLLILTSAFGSAVAQPSDPGPDSRVRVTHTCRIGKNGAVRCDVGKSAQLRRHTGNFLGVHGDSLLLQIPSRQTEVRLPLTAVRRLEVSHGQDTRWKAGSTIGLLAGAVAGGVIGNARRPDGGASFGFTPVEAYVAGGMILGAAAGFVAGAITGSWFKTDHWLDQPALAMEPLDPQHGMNAYAVSIRLRFR